MESYSFLMVKHVMTIILIHLMAAHSIVFPLVAATVYIVLTSSPVRQVMRSVMMEILMTLMIVPATAT